MHCLKSVVCSLGTILALSSCNIESETASCLAPINMVTGEDITYTIHSQGVNSSVRLEKIDDQTINLTRIENEQETHVRLRWSSAGHCDNFTTKQTLTSVENYLVYNDVPFSLLFNQETNGSPTEDVAVTIQQKNLNCESSPPYQTCEADFTLDNRQYHWRRVAIVDGAMPGFGVTEFSFTESSSVLLSIQMTQWNGS